jgi:hypothetical protein
VAVAGRDAVVLWNAQTVQEVGQLKIDAFGADLAFSPDATLLAVVGSRPLDDNPIELWNWKTGQLVYRFPTYTKRVPFDFGEKMFFSPSGKTLFTRTGGAVVLWDLEKGQRHRELVNPHRLGVRAFALTADGKRLATVGMVDGDVKIWDSSWLLDNQLQDGLAPLLQWGATVNEGDSMLTIALNIQGRKSGAALDAVSQLTRPTRLILPLANNLNDKDLGRLKTAGSLRVLDLQGASFLSAEGLRQLAGHPSLEKLLLPGYLRDPQAEDLAPLKELPALKNLTLRFVPVGAQTWKHLAAIPALTDLTVEGFIASEDRGHLADLPRLQNLTLVRQPLDEAWVKALLACAQLKRLRLVQCDVKEDAFQQLKKAKPQWVILQ